MRYTYLMVATGLLGLATASDARAGFIYTFDAASYHVAVNHMVQVTISIQWDGAGSNGLADPGLAAAGVGLSSTTPAGFAGVLNPTLGGDIQPNPSFDITTGYGPASGPPFTGVNLLGGLAEAVLFSSPPTD